MRRIAMKLGVLLLLLALAAPPALAGSLDGYVKLGGIIKDEDAGDYSAVPETYNIYDGFSLSRVLLDARMGERNLFHLDLAEVNQESARGLFRYKVPDAGSLTVRYDRHRQLYDAAGTVASKREDWRFAARVTPSRRVSVDLDYGLQTRDGNRLGYPTGNVGQLGTTYDYSLHTGRAEVAYKVGRRAVSVGVNTTTFDNHDLAVAQRGGTIWHVGARGPLLVLEDMLTHNLRASYGKQELTEVDTDNTLSTFEYLALLRTSRAWQVRYRFGAQRTDNSVSGYKTDRLRNDVDATWYHPYGSLTGGFGFVTNDDDRSLTRYEVWRVGATGKVPGAVKAKVSYATSTKTDEESRTLLQDIEDERFRASLQTVTDSPLNVGVNYAERHREFPVIQVEATGRRTGAFARLAYPGWGALHVDYSYSDDEYVDLDGGFEADNHTVSGRVEFDRVRDLRLIAGVTYLDIGKNLDIEKSILSFEGHYDLLDDYFVEAKYNVYNYDDYVLLDRYYTANIVWLNVGYKFSVE